MKKKFAFALILISLLGPGFSAASPASAKCATLPKKMGVAVGESTSYAWTKSGTAYAWGRGDFGQRGDGSEVTIKNTPQKAKAVQSVAKIASYGDTALFLQRDGSVFSVGKNDDGQLGLGSKKSYYSTPQKIKSLSCVTDIATGASTSFALKSDGSVWGWGYNADGELNVGNNWPTYTPKRVIGLSNIVSITAGEGNLFAVSKSGSLYALGWNFAGQLGIGSDKDPSRYPVKVSGVGLFPKNISIADTTVAAIQKSGQLVFWGSGSDFSAEAFENWLTPIAVPLATNASSVTLGWNLAMVVDKNKNLWIWGSNYRGALGLNLDPDCEWWWEQQCGVVPKIAMRHVSSVAGGENFSLAVQTNGSLWAWGSGSRGQLGNGYSFNTQKPSKVYRLNLAK